MPAGKPLLVFALEPHAAARFEALVAAFGSFHVCRDDTADPLPADVQVSGQPIIVVTRHLPAWVDRLQRNPNRYDAIYLRPAAVLMLDFFNQVIPGTVDELTSLRRRVLYLDGLLSRYPVLSVEDLFDDTTRASRSIARLLTDLTGAAASATRAADTDHGSNYNASVAALLVPAHTDGAFADDFAQDFAQHFAPDSVPDSLPVIDLDAVHRTAEAAMGTSVLEAGWSRPEPSYVWSEGSLATMRFPVPTTGGPFRCQLRGFVVGGNFVVRASIEGNLVGIVDKPQQQPRDIDIDIPLTLTRDHRAGPVRVNLQFDGAVSPFEVGLSGDRRKLGLALMSFRIYSVRPPLAQESRLTAALETLRHAGYHPLVAKAHDRNGAYAPDAADANSRTDTATPTFYASWRPGICMLVVRSGYGNLRDPIRFCAAAHCELILLVGDATASAELIAGDIHGPQVVPFTRDLQQALDALAHLQWQPDTIVLWDAKPDDAAIATMAARLRDPAGETCDLVLKTSDLRSLEPLNVALQEYADFVIAVDGAVLISSRAQSARRQCQ